MTRRTGNRPPVQHRDFGEEEEEQARNEEGETIEAEVRRAMADPAPEYLPPYEDPPDIDYPFVSE